MPFDMTFYSRFQQDPTIKMNLEDMLPSCIKTRAGFLVSGIPMYGEPSFTFMNYMIQAFYDARAFDLGKAPVYTYNSQHNRTYEADMWWAIAHAAFNNVDDANTASHAKAIYAAFCHNYLHWTAINGVQPESYAFPMVDLQRFENLPAHIAIRFLFLADLSKMLYNTILSSMTDVQIRLYADACLVMATLALPVYGFQINDL